MNITITADSTCDLPKELIERYHITITPLYVTVGDRTYRDGEDIDARSVLRMTEENGGLAKTAAVNIQDYLDVFSALLTEYDAIIHFTISSEMSTCYQNACIAANELGNIYVIDSRSLSTGIALLAMEACDMAAAGQSPQEICETLERHREQLDVSFVLATLEYLRRGGRCSSVAALGANLLKLRPCIQLSGGKMAVGKKYRGNIRAALIAYVRDKLADVETVDTDRIFITDSGLDEETLCLVEETVRECADFREIYHSQAGCTISGHCGPNCLGILFFRK